MWCGTVEDSVSFSMGRGKSAMKTSLPTADVGSRSVTPVGILRSGPVSPQAPPVSTFQFTGCCVGGRGSQAYSVCRV
jgi:hypothetical protein